MRVGEVLGVLEGLISATKGDTEGRLKAVLRRVKGELEVAGFLEGVDDEEMGKEGGMIWREEMVKKLREWEGIVERVGGKAEG